MTTRLSQWFTDLGPVDPAQPNSPFRYARYNGRFNGVKDRIGEGTPGNTYPVTILTAAKLDAPNPPFGTGETSSGGRRSQPKLLPSGTLRLRKWFTILGATDPTFPHSIYRFARYNGVYAGVKDRIREGEVGKVYAVTLMTTKKGSLLEAPNPPFTDTEKASALKRKAKQTAIKPKRPNTVTKAKKRTGNK
ncbi:MAG: hypothetical protein SH808_03765 [Saprospiraceae bacterium]|nr:hypothetical protein [Saprospiraceae bacterium]MDZ4752858.1 hypothetical protein [Flavobacteriales bacterium]